MNQITSNQKKELSYLLKIYTEELEKEDFQFQRFNLWVRIYHELFLYAKYDVIVFVENILKRLEDETVPNKIKGYYKHLLHEHNESPTDPKIFKVKFLIDGLNHVFYKQSMNGEKLMDSGTHEIAKLKRQILKFAKLMNYDIEIIAVDYHKPHNKNLDGFSAISIFFKENDLPLRLD